MKKLLFSTLFTTILSGMLIYVPAALADEHGEQGHGMGNMHGKEHGMHHDDDWHAALSKPQQKQIDKLHLNYLQQVAPVKAKLKAARIDLALLVSTDTANGDAKVKMDNDIDQKIDEIAKLTGEIMRIKAAHKIDVRSLLTTDQRVMFDLHVLNKAKREKCGH